MNLPAPIAFGRKSKIYALEKGLILKLYHPGFPKQRIQEEFEKTRIVYNAHALHVPEPKEIVEYDGKTGIIFNRISGVAFMDLFQEKPWLYFTYTPIITSLHREIHFISLSGLVTQEQEFKPIIHNAKKLSESEKELLLENLHQPYQQALCHGDFHHGNLIQSVDGKTYIIDWMDAFSGNPLLDVALTAVNAMVSDAPKHVPTAYRFIYEILKKIMKLDTRYLKYYGVEKRTMAQHLFLAAGIHLARHNEQNDSKHREYFNRTKEALEKSQFS